MRIETSGPFIKFYRGQRLVCRAAKRYLGKPLSLSSLPQADRAEVARHWDTLGKMQQAGTIRDGILILHRDS